MIPFDARARSAEGAREQITGTSALRVSEQLVPLAPSSYIYIYIYIYRYMYIYIYIYTHMYMHRVPGRGPQVREVSILTRAIYILNLAAPGSADRTLGKPPASRRRSLRERSSRMPTRLVIPLDETPCFVCSSWRKTKKTNRSSKMPSDWLAVTPLPPAPNLPTRIITAKIAWVKPSGKFPAGMGIPPLKIAIMLWVKPSEIHNLSTEIDRTAPRPLASLGCFPRRGANPPSWESQRRTTQGSPDLQGRVRPVEVRDPALLQTQENPDSRFCGSVGAMRLLLRLELLLLLLLRLELPACGATCLGPPKTVRSQRGRKMSLLWYS